MASVRSDWGYLKHCLYEHHPMRHVWHLYGQTGIKGKSSVFRLRAGATLGAKVYSIERPVRNGLLSSNEKVPWDVSAHVECYV